MSNNRFWSNPYTAPQLTSKVVLSLLIVSALSAFSQGLAFVFDGSSPASPSRVVLSVLLGLEFWGATLMAGAGVLLVGLVFRNHAIVWLSHVFLCALCVALTIMLWQSASNFNDGYGELILPFGSALWHGLFIWLSRPNFSLTALEDG